MIPQLYIKEKKNSKKNNLPIEVSIKSKKRTIIIKEEM